jgi:hypothetical protein
MQRHAYLLVAVLCAGLTPAIAHADEPPPESPKALESARELFAAGSDAYEKHDYEKAYQQYKASWSLHKHPATAGNLAGCESQLGRHRDAAQHFAYALRLAPLGDSSRATYEAGLKEAQTHVGTLVVEAPRGADLLVDDALVGKAPLADPVFVDPGTHTIRALTTEGAKELSVTVGPGSEQTVRLAIEPVAKTPASVPPSAASAPVKPPPVDTSSSERSGRLAASFVVGGIGVAGIAVGAVFGVKAIRDNDASNAGHCDEQTNLCDQAGADLRSSSRTAGNLSTAFVLGGLAFVGAGVVLFATAPADTKQAKVSAGPGSLWVSGTW